MKKFSLMFLVLVAGICHSNQDRIYVPAEKLLITERGMFINEQGQMVPVNSVSYDYSAGSFYLEKRERVLITCPSCGQKTYDPGNEICFNPDCGRAWVR
jgi:hypothetical protein